MASRQRRHLKHTIILALRAYVDGQISATRLKEYPVIAGAAENDRERGKMNNWIRWHRRVRREAKHGKA